VFELNKALGAMDTLKLTKIVNSMVATPKENPLPLILSVLYGFFSKLTAMQVSNSANKDTMKALGIWPAAQADYAEAYQNYKGRLKHAMKLLEEYDLRFKGVNDTGTDDGELLKEMVFKLAYL
jgi:DNA polymerase-3 subunit delta